MTHDRLKRLDAFLIPILAVLSGLVVSVILVLLTDTPPVEAYRILLVAGFGCNELTRCALFTTLERATPLILTGLSAVVAFRSGMFSIGQEGQYLLGAVMAAWLGYAIQLPPVIHPLFIMIMSMLAGAAYGWVPGVLRVKLGVNELLVTIVLNAIAVLFADLRSFTQFAEKRLPYDVVFVLNRYFNAMGMAIADAGGHLDKFIGDGVMALFGTEGEPENGARA
ncbi:MAG TPA: adenylate/guanylate cyclase domain-containing protein, partial [Anaerolineales bacterium]|nr:adenylate/guanylate cyclase domain-containing protein [Anaerolineales bacterium]